MVGLALWAGRKAILSVRLRSGLPFGFTPALPPVRAKNARSGPVLRQSGTHLSDDEAVAKMGHPGPARTAGGFAWWGGALRADVSGAAWGRAIRSLCLRLHSGVTTRASKERSLGTRFFGRAEPTLATMRPSRRWGTRVQELSWNAIMRPRFASWFSGKPQEAANSSVSRNVPKMRSHQVMSP